MYDWYRPMKYEVMHLWAVFVHLSIEEGYTIVIFSCCLNCIKTKMWKYFMHYMNDKLRSVEYFIISLLQDNTIPPFNAIIEFMDMWAFVHY